jgi:hypothetical protein
MHRHLVILGLLVTWSMGQPAAAEPAVISAVIDAAGKPGAGGPEIMKGNLAAYLGAITYGVAGDGLWQPPTSAQRDGLRATLQHLLAGSLAQAVQSAQSAGFRLIELTDRQSAVVYYVIRDEPTTANVSPGGTYVWRPDATFPAVVEVPHPDSDDLTHLQGIELFIDSGAELLLLAGTHRRSDLVLSPCSAAIVEDYRRSDPAHAVDHLFHVAHVTLEDTMAEPLFLQLHGFGSDGFVELSAQCGYSPPATALKLLVNISDGLRDTSADGSGAPPPGSFARTLVETVNADQTIRACLHNEDTSIYGGTLTTQGRYTNGSVDACNLFALQSSQRFIHIEQSHDVREHERALMNALIARALLRYFAP